MHFLEYGQIRKRGRIRIALVYPNLYRAGSASLAMHFIYNLANAHPSFSAERFFSDFTKSVETGSPLRDFDIIAFFLSFEEDYFNVYSILGEINSEEKLIIAGGICTLNPYPLSPAVDIFFLGDGEESFCEFLDIYAGLDDPKREKEAFESIAGVFIPGAMEKGARRTSPLSFHPTCQPIQHGDYPTSFEKSLMVEVSRGCSRFCKFCLVSHCQGVRREREVEEIERIVEDAEKRTKFSRIALIASDSHSHLKRIIEGVRHPVSLPSLKIEDIDEEILERLDLRTLTIAPETGETQRFRLNKRVSDDTIFEKVESVKRHVKILKVYLLFGLPGESEKDFSETIALARKFSKVMKTKFSINAFIPKPHTPFEDFDFDVEEVKRKGKVVRKELGVDVENPYHDFVQWCLSVGDERVFGMLARKKAREWYKVFKDVDFKKRYESISLG